MLKFFGSLLFFAGILSADIVTETVSGLQYDQCCLAVWATSSTTVNLPGFDPNLGTLESVDLTIAATWQNTLHYGELSGNTPLSGSITYTDSGTASYVGTNTSTHTANVNVPGESCLVPYCVLAPSLTFGGETVLTDPADLSAFTAGMVTLSASAGLTNLSVSPGIACCVGADTLMITPSRAVGAIYADEYLSLSATAVYTYAPGDPPADVPEPGYRLIILAIAGILLGGLRLKRSRHHRSA